MPQLLDRVLLAQSEASLLAGLGLIRLISLPFYFILSLGFIERLRWLGYQVEGAVDQFFILIRDTVELARWLSLADDLRLEVGCCLLLLPLRLLLLACRGHLRCVRGTEVQ